MSKTTLEIERKFLMVVGDAPALLKARRNVIKQGYLAMGTQREIRLRLRDQDCFMTVKEGAGLERGETEIALVRSQFDALWPLTQGRRIEKTRYMLPWSGHTIEVDVYEGRLAPLCVAEIEFPDLAKSQAFKKPAFLGQEVTGKKGYSNAHLAAFGLPLRKGEQIGCVPFLLKGKTLHIVLVRSSSRQRWIVPKGQSEVGMTHPEVALMEAAEEGGVVGTIEDGLQTGCIVTGGRELRLYALRVATLLKKWPEDSARKRVILPWKRAVESIADKALATAVEELATHFLAASDLAKKK